MSTPLEQIFKLDAQFDSVEKLIDTLGVASGATNKLGDAMRITERDSAMMAHGVGHGRSRVLKAQRRRHQTRAANAGLSRSEKGVAKRPRRQARPFERPATSRR